MAGILLLGPDRTRATGLRTLLREDGYRVKWLRKVEDWAETEKEYLPELVIAAVARTDSILAASPVRTRRFPAPLLFVQSDTDFFRDVFIDDRIVDRLESPFMSEDFLARVDALTRVRKVILRIGECAVQESGNNTGRFLSAMNVLRDVGNGTAAVLGRRLPRYRRPIGQYLEVAARVADWADHRDGFEPGHAERVACFCGMMADGLKLPDNDASALLRAAMLHDIGKVAMPVELLRQKSPLRTEQMRLMRTHPQRGASLLRELDRDEDVVRTILYHHEMMDGTGYYGRSARSVPMTSRILAVAETYDAMTSSRVRATVDQKTALAYLSQDDGVKYDGECVDALIDALKPRCSSIPLSEGFSF